MRTIGRLQPDGVAPGVRRVLIFSPGDIPLADTCLAGETVHRVVARDASSALRHARVHRPRLTVVDAAAPEASGLIRSLRGDDETRDTAIVALSGTPDLADETELRSAGANLVLAAPVSAAIWDGPVRRLLEVPPRRSARLRAAFEIWDGTDAGRRLRGVALNISLHGILLECSRPLAIGTKIDVRLAVPGGEVRALGEVIRDAGGTTRRFRRGVQFLVLRDRAAERIAGFVAPREKAPSAPPPESAQWEVELRGSESRLRGILDSAPEAVVLFDDHGRLRELNPAAERLFGCKRDKVLGEPAVERLVPEPARQLFRCALAQQVVAAEHLLARPMEAGITGGDGRTVTVELRFTRFTSKGRCFWTLHASETVDRRPLVEELQAAQRRFRALVENSADGIALLERDGRFRDLTTSAAQMMGFLPQDLVGRTFDELVDPADVEAAREVRRRCLELPGMPVAAEVRCRHRDGSWRAVEGIVVNHLETPEVRAIVVNYRDVTHRHRAQHLEEELRQAQKIEALGRLAGGVAHDFNNMIGVILGSARLAAMAPGTADARLRLEHVQQAAERAAALTRQLLAFSRKQVLMPEVVDVGGVVHEVAEMLERLLGEEVELVTAVPPRTGRVRVDRSQLEQALTNLVVNARDAMPQGGRVTVEAADVDVEEERGVLHPGVPAGAYVRLSVIDNGTGMDPETQRRAFEPFFTTKERGKGTGLGLSTTYGIVKQSGGHIVVDSTPGVGTRFTIFLPRVHDKPRHLADAPRPRSAPGGETVLLVEDDPMLRRVAVDILQTAGYSVLAAAGAEEGLDLGRRHPEPLPLVVTDIVMPGMSGRQLAERLVAERPETRVLYISGYTDDEILRHGIVEGTVDLLEKPFTPEALASAVRRVLDRAPTSASRRSRPAAAS